MAEPVDIGTRWEPLVDQYLIDELTNAEHRLRMPVRRETVFRAQPPIENACTGCYNLVQEGEQIRMYYRGHFPLGESGGDLGHTQTTNLAISADGIHFERPSLGLVEFAGSKDNNVVWRGVQSHNMVVFIDGTPSTPPSERFKAVGGCGNLSLYGLTSPDGIHWQLVQPEPLDIAGAFDSVNVAFWDARTERYRLFSRYWDKVSNVRAIQSCESEDFVHWTDPVPHQYADGVPWEHFYTNATVPCPGAEHILLSFPRRFLPQRTLCTEGMDYPGEGLSDAIMMSSRDGVHWDRTFQEAWVRPGLDPMNWTHRSQTPAVGIIATAPGEWSMYISEHYGWDTNGLRRITVESMRFASVHAGANGGELLTKTLTFAGRRLYLNYSTSAAGSVHVAVCDPDGQPLKSLDSMKETFGDELNARVAYDLSPLARRPVRLRFRLKDADLFAIRTGE